jgi:TetR/AcrR family transcriptional repressor of lmrAB and yxaGH operons
MNEGAGTIMKKVNTREELIKTTANLLQTNGYVGTGLNEIIKKSGAPKGSIYHHFPGGKEQLAVEAINWTKENVTSFIQKQLDLYADPIEAIQQFILDSASRFEENTYFKGVPIAAIVLETSASSEKLREACKDVFDAWHRIFVKKLMRNEYTEEQARKLALTVNSMLQGALVVSLARKDAESLRTVAESIPTLLKK